MGFNDLNKPKSTVKKALSVETSVINDHKMFIILAQPFIVWDFYGSELNYRGKWKP